VPGLAARILVGPANPYLETLRAEVERSAANLELIHSAADMPGLMAWADLAVTAAGCTCWELAFMQVPAVAMILAENQRRVAEPLAAAGAVTNLGWAERLTENDLAEAIASACRDRERRTGQIEAGRRIVDGHGADRVVAIMRALDGPIAAGDLTLRPVTRDDVLPVWRLANAPSVRLNSLSSDPIPLDTHIRWFREKLASPGTRMWALDLAGLIAGLIRYDRAGEDTASVHFSVPLPFRGRGLGTMLLKRTRKLAGEELGVKRLEAVVRQENAASARVFIKSGFTQVASKPIRGKACYVFEQHL
jgi:UDP-2,4-diacetamido-2,4,6-trideoxy-beta-L-altropyranose hydrolase